MTVPQFTTVEAFELSADGCERAGSPLYATLLRSLAADIAGAGITAAIVEGVSERPWHDAIPLRYVGTAHRLALAGRAPRLAELYRSCGGAWSPIVGPGPLLDAFLATVEEHRDEFVAGMQRNVQTNEVGRATVLIAGFSWLASRRGTPLRTLEIGASAGLLTHWPRFHYDTGSSTAGDPASPLRFDPSWFSSPPPTLVADLALDGRAACDVTPIDATSPDGQLTMLSFLWPDQQLRRERMLAALRIAEQDPITVVAADAGDWLATELGGGLPDGTTTVVYHSIVWQYLPRPTRDAMRAAMREAGAATTERAPLCWLRMEPATVEHADLRATIWPGGDETVLADVGYHGGVLRWHG